MIYLHILVCFLTQNKNSGERPIEGPSIHCPDDDRLARLRVGTRCCPSLLAPMDEAVDGDNDDRATNATMTLVRLKPLIRFTPRIRLVIQPPRIPPTTPGSGQPRCRSWPHDPGSQQTRNPTHHDCCQQSHRNPPHFLIWYAGKSVRIEICLPPRMVDLSIVTARITGIGSVLQATDRPA